MQWLKRKSGHDCRASAAARIATGDRGMATPATSFGRSEAASAAWTFSAHGSAPSDSTAAQKLRRVWILEFPSLRACIVWLLFTGVYRQSPAKRNLRKRVRRFPYQGSAVFAESHAAATRHTVISVEKTVGVVKAYLQLKAVSATKQMASAHAILRTRFNVSAGNPASSHANIAANKRNTEKKNPNALKKSQ